MLSRFLFWVRTSRVEFLTGSMMPVLVCGALAWHETGAFHWGYWLLTLLGMMLIHSGANLANDFFDHVSGNDEANTEFFNPFTGGSRVLQQGLARPSAVLFAALVALGAGSLIGLYLVWARGPAVLIIGLVGVGTAFFYTAPPFRLAHRGIGEFLIALDFGLLPSLGTYYVQAQELSWSAVVAGLPSTLLITAVLFINQFQDMRADAAVDKRHWVVRLGRKRARRVYYALVCGAPPAVLLGVAAGVLPHWGLLALLASALLPKALLTVARHYDSPTQLRPANVLTVAMHLATGVLLTVGILLGGH